MEEQDSVAVGHCEPDNLDAKIVEAFPGKVVRKDLTAIMKRGANVLRSFWSICLECTARRMIRIWSSRGLPESGRFSPKTM